MTVTREALDLLDNHWVIMAFGNEHREEIFQIVNLRLVKDTVGNQLLVGEPEYDGGSEVLDRLATAYEIAAIEGVNSLLYQVLGNDSETLPEQAQAGAYRAFEIRRVMPIPSDDETRYFHVLHLAALAYCGDRWADI